MKRYLKWLPVLMLLPTLVWAGDPCGASPMHYVSVAISTATTTSIVAPLSSGGNNLRIIVCGYNFAVSGTTPTFQFEEGTGSTCGTGTVVLSGAYAPTAGSMAAFGGAGFSITATDPGQRLCIVSGGTPGVNGILDYVATP